MTRLPEKTPAAQAEATLRFLHPPGGVFEVCIYGPVEVPAQSRKRRQRRKKGKW